MSPCVIWLVRPLRLGPRAAIGRELVDRYLEQVRSLPALFQDLVIFRQQLRAEPDARMHEAIVATLQQVRQCIEAILVEDDVRVGKPDPVGLRRLRGHVAPDAAPEQLFLRQRLPVPGQAGNLHAAEIVQHLRDRFIAGDMVNGHRDIELVRSMIDQRAQLIGQEMTVPPAVADDLELQLAGFFRLLDLGGIDVTEPRHRQGTRYGKSVEETDG